MGRARDLANILSSSGNVALDSEMGLALITPTSIAATGGSGSISTTGTVSFTSASAISLNGCFSNNYQNYRIVLSSSHSASSYVSYSIRMRGSGTDNTSNYINNIIYSTNGAGPSRTYSSATSALFSVSGDIRTFTNVDFSRPFEAEETAINSNYAGWASSNNEVGISQILHNDGTSYDGFTIFPGSGTITGTVRVYGYRN